MLMHLDEQRKAVESKGTTESRLEALKNHGVFFLKVSVVYSQVLILFITKNEQNSFPKAE